MALPASVRRGHVMRALGLASLPAALALSAALCIGAVPGRTTADAAEDAAEDVAEATDGHVADVGPVAAAPEAVPVAVTVSHTVSFDPAGGTPVPEQVVAEGEAATRPEDPTLEGLSFACWMSGGEPYDFSAPVMHDVTLTSVWVEDEPEPEPVADEAAPVVGPDATEDAAEATNVPQSDTLETAGDDSFEPGSADYGGDPVAYATAVGSPTDWFLLVLAGSGDQAHGTVCVLRRDDASSPWVIDRTSDCITADNTIRGIWRIDHTFRSYWADTEGINDWWVCFVTYWNPVDPVAEAYPGDGWRSNYVEGLGYDDGQGFHYGHHSGGCTVLPDYDNARYVYDIANDGNLGTTVAVL